MVQVFADRLSISDPAVDEIGRHDDTVLFPLDEPDAGPGRDDPDAPSRRIGVEHHCFVPLPPGDLVPSYPEEAIV